jgi:hypothetical protein
MIRDGFFILDGSPVELAGTTQMELHQQAPA